MAETKKEMRALQSTGRLKPLGYAFNVYTLVAEAGTTFEDVCRAEYWAHFSSTFRPRDEIIVHTEDGIFYAHLTVISVGRAWLNVRPLLHVPLVSMDVEKTQSNNFEVMFRGPRKWSIVHKKTKDVIREDIDNRDEAVNALAAMDKA